MRCRFCESGKAVKCGHRYNKKQIYKCKSCNCKFTENDGFIKMRHSPELITTALDLYYKGLSLRKISNHFRESKDIKVSHMAIFSWVKKYTKLIVEYTERLKVDNIGAMHADESMVNVCGKWMYYWGMLEETTRFIVASQLTKERKRCDAGLLFLNGKLRMNNKPRLIITDGYLGYVGAYRKVFWDITQRTVHAKLVSLADKRRNNNVMERYMGSFKERVKVARGYSAFDSANLLLRGWTAYYNFIRGHEFLDGKTPAEAMGIGLELKGNKWRELIKVASL